MPFLLLAVGAIVVVAAIYDATTLTIPNWISVALIGLFPIAAFLAGFDFSTAGVHVAVGVAALIVGMALFAFHLIGGGDAKFFAAVSFYVGLPAVGSYLTTVVIAGGVLAIILMFARRLANMGFSMDWFLKFTRGGSVIPYGIAIAFGALAVLPQTQIFAAAVS